MKMENFQGTHFYLELLKVELQFEVVGTSLGRKELCKFGFLTFQWGHVLYLYTRGIMLIINVRFLHQCPVAMLIGVFLMWMFSLFFYCKYVALILTRERQISIRTVTTNE